MQLLDLADATSVSGAGMPPAPQALHSTVGWSPKDVPVILPPQPAG